MATSPLLLLLGASLVGCQIAPLNLNFLPRPRFVVLGQMGVGKSSVSNALLGYDNTAKKRKLRQQSPFKVGHGLKSKTQLTTFSVGQWLGNPDFNVTVVDTPGFQDSKDAEFVEELTSVLGDEVPEVDAFLVVFKYKDRFTRSFKRTLNMLNKNFGNIWSNVVVCVTFWDYGEDERKHRLNRYKMDEVKYTTLIQKMFKKQIGAVNTDVPVVFLDSHFTKTDPLETAFFNKEANKLIETVNNMKSFECLSRTDIQKKLKSNKGKLSKLKRKENKKRRKLEAKLREMTSAAETSDSLIKYYKGHCPGVKPGCSWGAWKQWNHCHDGVRSRTRAKLIGEEDDCPGEAKETETGCTEPADVSDNWREHEDSVALVLGGVDGKGLGAGTEVLSNSANCRAPQLPKDNLENMVGGYDPNGNGVVVCGGLDKNSGTVSPMCYRLLPGSSTWEIIPNQFKLWGAAGAWLGGKFMIVGGSSSVMQNKNAKFEANNQGWLWDPATNTWESFAVGQDRSVVEGCMVTLEEGLDMGGEAVVFTGGSKRLNKLDKKNHGQKTASWKTSTSDWQNLPNMRKGRSGHGCTVATIDGVAGIVVAGGSRDGDSVEFLNWEEKGKWERISVLSRQRNFGTSLGHIRGRLSVIGGYSWPNTVMEVERMTHAFGEEDHQHDSEEEGWTLDPNHLADRTNHLSITVPANVFPSCTI